LKTELPLALSLENIDFQYGKKIIFSNISLKLETGKMYAVIGPNGSGKSTLLKIMCGLQSGYKGRIIIDSKYIQADKKNDFAAFLPAETEPSLPFTLEQTIDIHADLKGRKKHEFRQKASRLISFLGLSQLHESVISELSSGERRRLYLLLILSEDPALIALDEPDAHLDMNISVKLYQILKILAKDENKTVITATHDVNLALSFADEIILLSHDHKLDYFGPPGTKLLQKLKTVFENQITSKKIGKRYVIFPSSASKI